MATISNTSPKADALLAPLSVYVERLLLKTLTASFGSAV